MAFSFFKTTNFTSKTKIVFITVVISCLFTKTLSQQKLFHSKLKQVNLPPVKALQNLTFGLKSQLADMFWLRAVQDFDYCDQAIKEATTTAPVLCAGQSWLFQTLDMATTLDKAMEPVMYQTGGLALTVIISDYAGASIIFDRGVEQYPDVWQLLYSAAYHALYEEKNNVKAAKLYLAVSENGGPTWTKGMAARLATEGGETEFAEKVLKDMIESNDNPIVIERLKQKLKDVRSSQ